MRPNREYSVCGADGRPEANEVSGGRRIPVSPPYFEGDNLMVDQTGISSKLRLVALLFCFLFGIFGAHRFYVGKTGTAILMICTLGGGFGIWVMIDLILIALGSFRDKEGKRLLKWFEEGSI